ncbi:hypothetical protein ACIBUY_04000 [Streptomyces sp. NPDC050085]|uniref:hypothetical protein n=1 Tax=Streptomyces sp. NPDC050085 TaxID=3365600 RepID=UPI00379A5055
MDTQDHAGEVRLTVGNEIPIQRWTDEGALQAPEPLACPEPGCGQSTGLMLIARGREAVIRCPNDHEWSDRYVRPATIRHLNHLRITSQQVGWPSGHLWMPLLFPLDDNLAPAFTTPDVGPELGEGVRDRDDWWDVNAAIASGVARGSMFGECWREAWAIVNTVVPTDGRLYQRLYVPAGGNAVDAHMTILLLGLAIYEAARANRVYKLRALPLPAPNAHLTGDHLRTARPVADRAYTGVLPIRATDDRRLREASAEDWDRWCNAARDALSLYIDEQRSSRLRDWQPWELTLGSPASYYGPDAERYTTSGPGSEADDEGDGAAVPAAAEAALDNLLGLLEEFIAAHSAGTWSASAGEYLLATRIRSRGVNGDVVETALDEALAAGELPANSRLEALLRFCLVPLGPAGAEAHAVHRTVDDLIDRIVIAGPPARGSA